MNKSFWLLPQYLNSAEFQGKVITFYVKKQTHFCGCLWALFHPSWFQTDKLKIWRSILWTNAFALFHALESWQTGKQKLSNRFETSPKFKVVFLCNYRLDFFHRDLTGYHQTGHWGFHWDIMFLVRQTRFRKSENPEKQSGFNSISKILFYWTIWLIFPIKNPIENFALVRDIFLLMIFSSWQLHQNLEYRQVPVKTKIVLKFFFKLICSGY